MQLVGIQISPPTSTLFLDGFCGNAPTTQFFLFVHVLFVFDKQPAIQLCDQALLKLFIYNFRFCFCCLLVFYIYRYIYTVPTPLKTMLISQISMCDKEFRFPYNSSWFDLITRKSIAMFSVITASF